MKRPSLLKRSWKRINSLHRKPYNHGYKVPVILTIAPSSLAFLFNWAKTDFANLGSYSSFSWYNQNCKIIHLFQNIINHYAAGIIDDNKCYFPLLCKQVWRGSCIIWLKYYIIEYNTIEYGSVTENVLQ